MIKLGIDSSGEVTITQTVPSPFVYLDTWALKDIGEDALLTKRFIEILKRRNGTLGFSCMHLLEFSRIGDKHQIDKIESFLETIQPDLACIDVIPKRVIDRENLLLSSKKGIDPILDESLLKFLVTRNKKSLNPLSIKGLLLNTALPKIIETTKTFMQKFIDPIMRLREEKTRNSKYKYKVSNIFCGPKYQKATRYINAYITNSLIRNNLDISTSNNFLDLFHTIVPLAYCGFLLVDNHWAQEARNVTLKLQKSNQLAEIAHVFSKKDMDKFWKEFDI